jgi:hypothetical protein
VTQTNRYFGGSRNFILGPTLELRLPLGLAVEADALYRPMEFRIQETISQLFTRVTLVERGDVWEFPILAKYRLPLHVVKPYLAAGPSFRATSSSLGKYMSGRGISAEIGIETRVGPLVIAPEVRYTHWSADGAYESPNHLTSYPNQVEFLMGLTTGSGVSAAASPSASGWRKYLAVGVKGGLPFMTAFIADSYGRVTYASVPCVTLGPNATACAISEGTVETHQASRNYLVGPTVEVHLPRHLSIEADALYGPLSLATPAIVGSLPAIQTYGSWSFPIVGKYRFHLPFVKPYLEAGPTFRTASSPINHYLAKAGVAAGVGVEGTAWKIHLSPEVRFVRWGADASDAGMFYASRRNQAQFLVGVSY